MRTLIPWLFTVRGTVSSREFLTWGFLLLVAKAAVDTTLCWALDLPTWSPLLYVTPLPWTILRGDAGWRWAVFALPSLAFCWIGIALTWRRLRDAGMARRLLAWFFLPFGNLLLFVLLGVAPTAAAPADDRRSPAATAMPGPLPGVVSAALTFALAFLGFTVLRDYGGLLFFGLPMLQGVLVGLFAVGRTFANAFLQLLLSWTILVFALLLQAAEGLICIMMASPPWLIMGTLGLVVGRAMTPMPRQRLAAGLLAVPLLQWLEPTLAPAATVYEVRTDIVVQAAPERVWQSLVAFEPLPPPTELPFRLGVAFPQHATIDGVGPGAVRRCTFSTGDFVEPIEVWDEPRLLRFTVTENPPPLQEWNPFHAPEHVHAAHLHGYFRARRGQFELVPLGDGTTRLCGTTWYSHGLRPEAYWREWSDWLVQTIHRRVLEHIRRTAER